LSIFAGSLIAAQAASGAFKSVYYKWLMPKITQSTYFTMQNNLNVSIAKTYSLSIVSLCGHPTGHAKVIRHHQTVWMSSMHDDHGEQYRGVASVVLSATDGVIDNTGCFPR
jgi:hypothetical protein